MQNVKDLDSKKLEYMLQNWSIRRQELLQMGIDLIITKLDSFCSQNRLGRSQIGLQKPFLTDRQYTPIFTYSRAGNCSRHATTQYVEEKTCLFPMTYKHDGENTSPSD